LKIRVLQSSLMSSVKTAIYPNSLILERHVSTFFEKKGRVQNLVISAVGPVHRGGGRGKNFILQMRPWLGFRRGARGWVRMNEQAVCD
jgi:hypothetical protein